MDTLVKFHKMWEGRWDKTLFHQTLLKLTSQDVSPVSSAFYWAGPNASNVEKPKVDKIAPHECCRACIVTLGSASRIFFEIKTKHYDSVLSIGC